ncbi:hypothetical protein [Natronospira bacteriovora]|uniref:DUF2946 domain-containing protein n=1 Tax=Natronospira bacteriovora TaxID=3069753 RepID=A0ABU0W9E0_9GAMM|nr:hypothetical protein [Natronospira sp. AB-CW4]MDQ2070378.1 hypothetical protein [Natronospira sp. AB-CW4]
MRTVASRTLLLLLLSLSLATRAVVPLGFMPGQGSWLEFCPDQGWDTAFLERVQQGDVHPDHDHHHHHGHGPHSDQAEATAPHCPWSPLASDYALIDTALAAQAPDLLPILRQSEGAAIPASIGLRLPPVRAPPHRL